MNYADLFRVTLPETALEVAALVVLVVDLAFLRKAALKLRVTVAALLGVAGCGAALWALQWRGDSDLSYNGDIVYSSLLLIGAYTPVAQIGILVLTAITLLLLIDSIFTKHVGEYVAVVLMAATGGLLIAAAQDLLVIFVGLELMSLGLYILTAFAKSSGKSAEAALKYYLFGGMSAAFLLFGFSYFYGLTGSTNLCEIQRTISESGPSPLFYVAWILVVAGLGFKIAAVPFHLWAPDTYEGAPAPAAAFIASVSKVASFSLLITLSWNWLRVSEPVFGEVHAVEAARQAYFQTWPRVAIILLVVAAASMIVGNLAALAQVSVRRLLAYSAIAHAGYILLGVSVQAQYIGKESAAAFIVSTVNSAVKSTDAVLYYVLTYGLTIIGAFSVVSVVERATGSDRLDSFLGLSKKNPLLASVLLVYLLSLAGIPPLVGFWAKFNLFAAVLGVSAGPVPFALVALAIAMSVVSLYYYLQVLKRAYVMPAIDESSIKAHPVTMAVLLLIAAAVVVLGCFPALLLRWIDSFYHVI
ncbi:MAG: NADH-quinone oxidoreductase subunit N [Terracidiphilus sp.]|jgi:NADH-quinone oxidoreductase subunit N